ncbi:MAG TPA: hypothetical protein DCR48_07525 [Flavobacteriales bacterium]|nr:hypothetical protein [Flavobacteriales bacterium]
MKTIILDHTRIERTVKRIAFQILEHCHEDTEITLIGVKPRGVWVAKQIESALSEISEFKVSFGEIEVENLGDLNSLESIITGKSIILIDDVIKSGETMMIAASAIVNLKPKLLITACLVDRKHRRFPIQSDFTGLSLATTIQEHIRLVIDPVPTIYLE